MTKSIEEILKEAIERGDFIDLSNKGKKLYLEDYFNTPEDLRVSFSVLKSADFVPEEVQLLKEIGELQQKRNSTRSETERNIILKDIEYRRLKYNLLMDRRKQNHAI